MPNSVENCTSAFEWTSKKLLTLGQAKCPNPRPDLAHLLRRYEVGPRFAFYWEQAIGADGLDNLRARVS